MKPNWISHPTILKGVSVDLIPLEEEHLEELCIAASDKELWEHIPTNGSDKSAFYRAYHFALAEREKENQYPFAIRHKKTNQLIGSTRLFEIYPDDRKLEIGWTWIIKQYWGTEINLECKLLLLTFCFETLKASRVQLKTKDTNIKKGN